jgi:hypothetical protein
MLPEICRSFRTTGFINLFLVLFLIWFLDLMSKKPRIVTIIWLTVDYASAVQLIRWHDTATDESTECTSGAFVIAPSAVATLFRISIFIYDHSVATLSARTVKSGE